jgi:ADP-ribose pyrophosphatase
MEPKTIAQGKFISIKSVEGWEYAERTNCSGIVIIVPVFDDGRVILVEQNRKPVQAHVIELPAGLAGDDAEKAGEPLLAAAKRELLEETGYEAEYFHEITAGPPSPGLSTEVVTFFGAYGLKKAADGGGVEGEDITVHIVPMADVFRFCEDQRKLGKMVDPKVYAGLFLAAVK